MLDTFQSPSLVKIDVEGAEECVLQGAQIILSDCRPRFYVEVGSLQRVAVTSILKKHGYKLYEANAAGWIESEDCAFNTLAVPSEKSPPVAARDHYQTNPAAGLGEPFARKRSA